MLKFIFIVSTVILTSCGPTTTSEIASKTSPSSSNSTELKEIQNIDLPLNISPDLQTSAVQRVSARYAMWCSQVGKNTWYKDYTEFKPVTTRSGASCNPKDDYDVYSGGYVFECDSSSSSVVKSTKGEAADVMREMAETLGIPRSDLDRVEFHYMKTNTINAYATERVDLQTGKKQPMILIYKGLVNKLGGLGDGSLLAVLAHEYGHRVYESHGEPEKIIAAARKKFIDTCNNGFKTKSEYDAALTKLKISLFDRSWKHEKFADDYITQLYQKLAKQKKLTFNPWDAANAFEIFDWLGGRVSHDQDPHRPSGIRRDAVQAQIGTAGLNYKKENEVDRGFAKRLLNSK